MGAGCALLPPAEDDEGEDAEAGEGGGGGGVRPVAIRWARVTCALKNKCGDMVSRFGTSSLVCDSRRRRASDKCMKEKRKTINGDDLIWSMGMLGFEDYVEPLKLHLKLYREVEADGVTEARPDLLVQAQTGISPWQRHSRGSS